MWCSQENATGPYPQPNESRPHTLQRTCMSPFYFQVYQPWILQTLSYLSSLISHDNIIWCGKQIIKLLFVEVFHPLVISATLHKYFNQNFVSSTLNLFVFLRWKIRVSHPYKTNSNIVILYILIFIVFYVGYKRTVEWYIDREKQKNSEKTLSQCHFFHHKSHMDRPGREPGPPQWEAGG
jgi:hypothetical protein